MKKEIGIIGLGKMGENMALALYEKGYEVTSSDKSSEAIEKIQQKGIAGVHSLQELVQSLQPPRLIWIMVPHQAVDAVTKQLLPLLEEDDTVVDGGNSYYQDSIRRYQAFKEKGVNFLDVGVSGGPSGARNGACLMVGGDKKIYDYFEQLFADLSVKEGYGYMGKSGAGHFVKMVHNGIEYGMMQAIAEGFTLMHNSPEFDLDLEHIAHVYNHGSVIESHLVNLAAEGFKEYGQDLESIKGSVGHSGEAKWTVQTAHRYCEEGEDTCSVPVIEDALQFRVDSEDNPSYTGKILSMLRNMFGGHKAKKQ